MINIEPRKAEYISVKQALEWLSMGWIPYIDNDERLIAEDRESIRCCFNGNKIEKENEHFYTAAQLEYCRKMYRAVGALENLLSTEKLQIDDICTIRVWNNPEECEDCRYRSLPVCFESYYIRTDDSGNLIISFYCDYGNWSNCYCETIGDCLKFSELKKFEPLFMDNSRNVQKCDEAVNTENYSTPELQIINEVIKERGENINIIKMAECSDIIKQKAKKLSIDLSNRQITAICTVIRKPEAKKGGAKPQRAMPKYNIDTF